MVPDSASRWDARITRARTLATEHRASAEILEFYARLAEWQRYVVSAFRRTGEVCAVGPTVHSPARWTKLVDLESAAAQVSGFLEWLERAAPVRLAALASNVRAAQPDWTALMRESLLAEDEGPDDDAENAAIAFVVEAVLQPYAETAAAECQFGASDSPRESLDLGARCPVCSGRPLVGALREDGQGASRLLVCARCLIEWRYRRVVCAECGEQRFDALPVYTAEAFPHVRIEACDSCRSYLKTIDLTKNGLAVPLVDDLASVPLDLWAQERGYRRTRANLLRTTQPVAV
jgi:FdhE protein